VLQKGVYFSRIAVALPADRAHERRGASAGKVRMDVHVAFHDFHSKFTGLRRDDIAANILKT
jgi:hypothetical protein